MGEVEDGAGECCEILLSGPDTAVAIMTSQKRRLSHTIKAVQILAWIGKALTRPHLCLRSH